MTMEKRNLMNRNDILAASELTRLFFISIPAEIHLTTCTCSYPTEQLRSDFFQKQKIIWKLGKVKRS